jgi:hypothetical protein
MCLSQVAVPDQPPLETGSCLTTPPWKSPKQQGKHAFDKQLNDLVNTLTNISQNLKAVAPDEFLIHGLVASLRNTWIQVSLSELSAMWFLLRSA